MVALSSLVQRRARARKVLDILNAAHPNPRCELVYHTPYQLLVSVVLSAQTTDLMVNRVMAPQYEKTFTPQVVLKMGEPALLDKIRTIGLAPTKAKNVLKLSQMLVDQYDGKVPHDREALESLPGVGRKTANVVLGEIFGDPTLAVDTHVYRVTRRLGLQDETTAEKAEQELLKVIDPSDLPAGHHHLILLGRYVCKAIKPACDVCLVNEICPSAFLKGMPGGLATGKKKPAAKKAAKSPTKKAAKAKRAKG